MNSIKLSFSRLLSLCFILLAVMLMASCGKKKHYDVEYLAVQFEKGQNWSIIDASGNVVISEEFDKDAEISIITDGAFWVKDKNGYQLFSIDNPKKPLIDDYFKSATRFVNGYSFVSKDGSAIEVINTKGKTVKTLPANITMVYGQSPDGYVCYYDVNKKLCGLLDEDGDIVMEAKYADLTPVVEDVALASEKGSKKVLIINPKGKEQGSISSEKYDFVSTEYSDGLIPVVADESENKEVMYLDKKGEKVMSLKKSHYNGSIYYRCSNIGYALPPYTMYNGYVVYGNDSEKFGVADKNGEMLIRAKYDRAYPYIGEGFVARKSDKWGLIDAEDKEILEFDYDEIAGITVGGNYLVKIDGLYNIIDKEANRVGKDEFYDVSCSMGDDIINAISIPQIVTSLTSPLTADSYDGISAKDNPTKVASVYNVKDPKSYLNDKYIRRYDVLNKQVSIDNRCFFYTSVSEMQDEENCSWIDASIEGILVDFSANSDMNIDKKALMTAVVAELKKKGFTADDEFDMQQEYIMKGKGKISLIIILNKYGNNFALALQYNNSDNSEPEPDAEADNTEDEMQPDDAPANKGAQASLPDYSWLSTRLVTESDMAGKNSQQLRIMRNYIFARHGYIFKDNALTQHFSQYSWYKPTSKDVLGKFNSYEKKNVAIIKARE